jgi:hypothetical protein
MKQWQIGLMRSALPLAAFLLCCGAPLVPGPSVRIAHPPDAGAHAIDPARDAGAHAIDPTPDAGQTDDTCAPSNDLNDSKWSCDVVSALEVVDLFVSAWTGGRATLSVVVKNRSPDFLNYPGVQVGSSLGTTGNDLRYGMFGCDTTTYEIGVDVSGARTGDHVTFTASAGAIVQGSPCTEPPSARSLTATAP